eukprot:CAMPEP_0167775332 /NCGR_PEP_ID=MMETSP0111_2-20121227/2498_1 /TAXON_ID=91324 /ORGANISM="Lotharella globosa, Strain CCCM811" /LENGTH=509 /DNA_ID=CAMNT_0007665231 /DNA_START=6 /DNA_END=1535 /DNA_ORIENTATION=+
MPARVYRLVGPSRDFSEAPFMGMYTEQPSKKSERKVCIHHEGKFRMFYCNSKGQWIVGVDDKSGEGWLYVESNAKTPDKVVGGWSFWNSVQNDWVQCEELRVVRASSVEIAQQKMHHLSVSSAVDKKGGRVTMDSFRVIRVIGKGSFGTVKLAVKKSSGQVMAIKSLKKKEMIKREQQKHIWGERNYLASADSPWVVKLYHTFQDKRYLYFALEYCSGGDLLRLLIQEDKFTESQTAFYMAELASAVEAVHYAGYIHRDIKPDNILVSESGHLKLTDFGLCKQLANDKDEKLLREISADTPIKITKSRKKLQSCVGTPDYVAPEVLERHYNKECDWWSVGVILYECLIGYPPFMTDNLRETAKKIQNFKKHLKIPATPVLSDSAKDIIFKLLTDADKRIKFDGLLTHPFFEGIDWKNLHTAKPPFVPEVNGKLDSSLFDDFNDNSVRSVASMRGNTAKRHFPNFTWNRRPSLTPGAGNRNKVGRPSGVFSSNFFDAENNENNPNANQNF